MGFFLLSPQCIFTDHCLIRHNFLWLTAGSGPLQEDGIGYCEHLAVSASYFNHEPIGLIRRHIPFKFTVGASHPPIEESAK
jgi:hypothetical protein